jgi:RNA polymerase sigma-70 factor (ECF subfamily)
MVNALTLNQKNSIMTPVATEHTRPQPVSPEMQAQEQRWALAAQKGDQAAFIRLVEVYQRPVYNLCYRMLGGDPGEAEDAAQETFLRAYTKLKTYNASRKFSSWLLSIASHYCIDRLRQRRYQTVGWDDLTLPEQGTLSSPEPQPEAMAVAREERDTLRTLLNNLPPDYRAATILRYWHELSYEEIAETLNTSISAIKSRLFRARQMMAEQMELREQRSAGLRQREDARRKIAEMNDGATR